MFDSIREPLYSARDEARDFMDRGGHRPKVFTWSNITAFFNNIPSVITLIEEEPELIFFAVCQWLVIWLAYVGWTQMLHWIPDEVWNAVGRASKDDRKGMFEMINLLLLGWSFFIVCIASYPIGLCSAAMVAVHDLRACKEKVSLDRCFAIADRHLGKIWMFTVLDGWITVSAILSRLPKKHYHRTALDELLYYAWKVATMGMVPALVNGRDWLAAGKDSVKLLMSQPARALGLRFGYSAVCWVIGGLSYIGAIYVFVKFGDKKEGLHYIYNFYLLMAAPIFVSVGVISVFVRPFFLLGVAKFYTDTMNVAAEIEKDIAEVTPAEEVVFSGLFCIFALMLSALLALLFFGNQLGFGEWINHLSQLDLARYNQH
jgi:hypothetical protein